MPISAAGKRNTRSTLASAKTLLAGNEHVIVLSYEDQPDGGVGQKSPLFLFKDFMAAYKKTGTKAVLTKPKKSKKVIAKYMSGK